MRELCLVLASCGTLFVGRAKALVDGNEANVATTSRSPPHRSEIMPKQHRLLQPYGSAVDTTTSVAQRLLKSGGPVTENTKFELIRKEERVLDIAEVKIAADEIAKVLSVTGHPEACTGDKEDGKKKRVLG
uniref:Uncharacterized protein n=1 Tax=Peronospora matthiolae TaxID=2874970 RepID=A0AAV1UQC5_9STRA